MYGFPLLSYSNCVKIGRIVFALFYFKYAVTLKTGLGVHEGH